MKLQFLAFVCLISSLSLPGMAQELGQDLLIELEDEKKEAAKVEPIAPPAAAKRREARPITSNQVTVVVPDNPRGQVARSIGAYFDADNRYLIDQVGRCTIMMPAAPTFSKVRAETKFAPLVIRNLELKMKGAIITLAHTEYPKEFTDGYEVDVDADPFKLLTLASDSQLRARNKSKLLAREKLQVDERPAIEQVVALPELTLTDGTRDPARVVFSRCILRKRDIYAISINIEQDFFEKDPAQSKETVKKFMESFKFIR